MIPPLFSHCFSAHSLVEWRFFELTDIFMFCSSFTCVHRLKDLKTFILRLIFGSTETKTEPMDFIGSGPHSVDNVPDDEFYTPVRLERSKTLRRRCKKKDSTFLSPPKPLIDESDVHRATSSDTSTVPTSEAFPAPAAPQNPSEVWMQTIKNFDVPEDQLSHLVRAGDDDFFYCLPSHF